VRELVALRGLLGRLVLGLLVLRLLMRRLLVLRLVVLRLVELGRLVLRLRGRVVRLVLRLLWVLGRRWRKGGQGGRWGRGRGWRWCGLRLDGRLCHCRSFDGGYQLLPSQPRLHPLQHCCERGHSLSEVGPEPLHVGLHLPNCGSLLRELGLDRHNDRAVVPVQRLVPEGRLTH